MIPYLVWNMLSYFIAQSGGATPIYLKVKMSFFKSNDTSKTGLCLCDITRIKHTFTIASRVWKNGNDRISSEVLHGIAPPSSFSTTRDKCSSIYSYHPDLGATELAKLLLESSNIQHFTFHCGKITEEIGTGMAAVLSGNKKLQVLNLSGST